MHSHLGCLKLQWATINACNTQINASPQCKAMLVHAISHISIACIPSEAACIPSVSKWMPEWLAVACTNNLWEQCTLEEGWSINGPCLYCTSGQASHSNGRKPPNKLDCAVLQVFEQKILRWHFRWGADWLLHDHVPVAFEQPAQLFKLQTYTCLSIKSWHSFNVIGLLLRRCQACIFESNCILFRISGILIFKCQWGCQ